MNSSPIFCSDEFCHKVFCLAQNSLVLHKVLTRSKALLDGFVDASSLMSLGVVRLDVGVVSDDSYKWGTVAIDGYWGGSHLLSLLMQPGGVPVDEAGLRDCLPL